jgi:hypothetical protein
MERPNLFKGSERGRLAIQSVDDAALVRKTLRAASFDRIYERLFATVQESRATP